MPAYLRLGLLIGVAYIIVLLFTYYTDLRPNDFFSRVLFFIICFGGIFYGVYAIRERVYGGYISANEAFKEGFKLALVAITLAIVFQYCCFRPMRIAARMAIEAAKLKGEGYNQEQIDRILFGSHNLIPSPMEIIIVVILIPLLSYCSSAIVANILQKKKPETPIAIAE